MIDKAGTFVDKNVNIEEEFLKQNDVDKLYKAISKLKLSEQDLIHKLYLSEHPMTQAKYAKSHHISYTTLRKTFRKTSTKIKINNLALA